MKRHFHDDTRDAGYEAMAQALTLLGFDVPKLIEYVATTSEPIWTELTLAYLRVELDTTELQERAVVGEAGLAVLRSAIDHIWAPEGTRVRLSSFRESLPAGVMA